MADEAVGSGSQSLELLSLERSGGQWLLTLALPAPLLGRRGGPTPAVHVCDTGVRVEGADGNVASYSLPLDSEPIDSSSAVCRLQRRLGQLVVSWPESNQSKECSAASQPACEHDKTATAMQSTLPNAAADIDATAVKAAPRRRGVDYSRFDHIDDPDEVTTPAVPGWPEFAVAPPLAQPSIANAPTAETPKPKSHSVDYSRFDEVNEDDATLERTEIDALWRRHCKLRRMRGEEPLSLTAWRRTRAKPGSKDANWEIDPYGRGLWCKTNMEDEFEREAKHEDDPPDDSLPTLPTPDLLGAMTTAPGVQTVDRTAWAKVALRTELLKACASNRSEDGLAADIRVDAIAHHVDVGDGNAAVLIEDRQLLCAFRFRVEISYCVNLSERPTNDKGSTEVRYTGDIKMPELASGAVGKAVAEQMRTSLRDPRPTKKHLAVVRPVVARLELSVAHFVRRFERRLLLSAHG